MELAKHDAKEVAAAAKKWAASLDKSDKEYEHHRLEALWTHQWVDVVDVDLLKEVLAIANKFRAFDGNHTVTRMAVRSPNRKALVISVAYPRFPAPLDDKAAFADVRLRDVAVLCARIEELCPPVEPDPEAEEWTCELEAVECSHMLDFAGDEVECTGIETEELGLTIGDRCLDIC